MKRTRGLVSSRRAIEVALLTLSLLTTVNAFAQDFPTHTVTMVIPVAPGGAMDSVGRLIASGMRTQLGQTVVVENAPGASGVIGVGKVARAAPDGYTVVYSSLATQVISAATMIIPYDVVKDFRPVAFVTSAPWVIATRKDFPVPGMAGLVKWLRDHPDGGSMGTGGIGTPSHLGGMLLQKSTGTRFRFIPYKGNAPVIQDLIAGRVDFAISDPVTALPYMRSGLVNVIAVLANQRIPGAPDVPTIDEAGYPDLHLAPWQAIWAPRDTPTAVVNKLNAAVVATLADPRTKALLSNQGFEIGPASERTPEYLGTFHKAEIAKWGPLVKSAGVETK